MKDWNMSKTCFALALVCFVLTAGLFFLDPDISQRHLLALGFVGLSCTALAPLVA